MFYLRRTRPNDGAGDSGGMSEVFWKDGTDIKREYDARPRIGVCVRVGSRFARTMSWQDWWQTSYITKIISDTPKKVVFETKNSEYVWECD